MNSPEISHLPTVNFDTVLSLLRASVWGEGRFPFHAPEDTDWDAVYQELQQQTVQHLPVDILTREDPRRGEFYTNHAIKNMMRWYKIMQEQQALCRALRQAGIPCAVVKGASAACYYPHPANRVMGDIDILVKPEDFDRACDIVSAGAAFLGENARHREYRRNGVIVEVHRRFGSFRDAEKNTLLDTRLFSALGNAEEVTTDNYAFFRLPTAENGLSLLLHIDVHLENGLGLRQIIDWMLFVDRELSDPVWHAEFAPLVKQLERETLAVTVTRMCQMYLGLRSDITWCAGADEQLCETLMEYIFNQGNFGRKTQQGLNRAVSVVNASKNIVSFFRILQHRGCINWKATSRYPFLKAFAWLYQLLRYLYYGLRAEHPLQLLRSAFQNSKSKTRFLEALGVSCMEEEGK